MQALKPIRDKDSREGHKAILDTMSFMDFLASIMRKLPDDLQDVIKLPLLGWIDPDVISDRDSEDSEEERQRGRFRNTFRFTLTFRFRLVVDGNSATTVPSFSFKDPSFVVKLRFRFGL